jgi:hypothetical protein
MKNPLDNESSDSFALINAEAQHSLVRPLPRSDPRDGRCVFISWALITRNRREK